MQVVTFLRGVFKSKRQKAKEAAMAKLGELKPRLLELKRVFGTISRSSDQLTNIVLFFEAMSWWHDRGGVIDLIILFNGANTKKGEYDAVIQTLEIFDTHIRQAGRYESGWNRTKKGETVTDDHVYLGNIYGLFTKTVSFWKKCKDDKKDGWKGTRYGEALAGMNAYDVVSEQAREFMDSHIVPMIKLIDDLYQY